MALTVTLVRAANTALGKEAVVDVNFDASYPTNGETLNLAAAPLSGMDAFTAVDSVSVTEGPYTSAGAKIASTVCTRILYDFAASRAPATGLLVAHAESATGEETEVANTTDLSTVFCRLHVIGR